MREGFGRYPIRSPQQAPGGHLQRAPRPPGRPSQYLVQLRVSPVSDASLDVAACGSLLRSAGAVERSLAKLRMRLLVLVV
mmetsp:Transcript_90478/g.256446  ORF Transcript_90478/g.256446 Transcript_90478/m.256446 type:complete len:80 (-) Transcript_90478:415-654(-)